MTCLSRPLHNSNTVPYPYQVRIIPAKIIDFLFKFSSTMNDDETFLNLDLKELDKLDINKLTAILRKQKKFTRGNAQLVSSLYAGDYINYADPDNVCWTEGGPVLKKECLELLQDDTDN